MVHLDVDGILVDNLFVPQGVDWNRTYPVSDPITGAPQNITGWTLVGQVRQTPSSSVLYEWKAANGNVECGNGFAKITVPDTDSDAWTWIDQAMKYDLELTDPGTGKKMRLSKGAFAVTAQITHD